MDEFAEVVRANEPRFLRAAGFPDKYHAEIKRLLTLLNSEIHADYMLDSASEYEARPKG